MATIEYGVPELTAKIDWYSRQLSHDVDKREQMSFSKVENAVTMQGRSFSLQTLVISFISTYCNLHVIVCQHVHVVQAI